MFITKNGTALVLFGPPKGFLFLYSHDFCLCGWGSRNSSDFQSPCWLSPLLCPRETLPGAPRSALRPSSTRRTGKYSKFAFWCCKNQDLAKLPTLCLLPAWWGVAVLTDVPASEQLLSLINFLLHPQVCGGRRLFFPCKSQRCESLSPIESTSG